MNIHDYAAQVAAALPQGVLLNTAADKFNSMVIGWGHEGVLWGQDVFVIYVRQSRYTKGALDRTGAFTVSAPLPGGKLSPEVMRACGAQSGRDLDKASLFTLVPGRTVDVPAIREYPLTLECRVLYQQDQDLDKIPQAVLDRYYGRGNDVGDFHTAYFAKIEDAYIIE